MATGRQQIQLSLELDLGEDDLDIVVAYDVGADETITLSPAAATLYNDRTGVVTRDLLAWVGTAMNAQSAHTWTWGEPSGSKGRAYLRTAINGDEVTGVTIPAALEAALGFSVRTLTTVTAGPINTTTIQGAYQRSHLWIPGPAQEVYLARAQKRPEDVGVMTMGATGPLLNDIYGSRSPLDLEVTRFRACYALQAYADDSEYTAFAGDLTAGDPSLAFDSFCRLWARQPGLAARLAPDATDPTTWITVKPGAWVNRPIDVLQEVSRKRLAYLLACEVFAQ